MRPVRPLFLIPALTTVATVAAFAAGTPTATAHTPAIHATESYGSAGATVPLTATFPKGTKKLHVEEKLHGEWKRVKAAKGKTEGRNVLASATSPKLVFGTIQVRLAGVDDHKTVSSKPVNLAGYKWMSLATAMGAHAPQLDYFTDYTDGSTVDTGGASLYAYDAVSGWNNDGSQTDNNGPSRYICRKAELGVAMENQGDTAQMTWKVSFASGGHAIDWTTTADSAGAYEDVTFSPSAFSTTTIIGVRPGGAVWAANAWCTR